MNYWAADNGAPQVGWLRPIATFFIEAVSRKPALRHPSVAVPSDLDVCLLGVRTKEGSEFSVIRVPCDTITAYHVGDELDVIHRPGSHS